MQRRKLLSCAIVGGTITIAGCADSSDNETTSSSANNPEEDNETTSSSANNPEEAMRQYMTALEDGDAEGANAVLHPESPIPTVDTSTVSETEITLNEINEVSIREAIEQEYGEDATETEIQQQVDETNQTLESITSANEAEDSAIVLVSWTQEGEPREQDYIMLQDGGDWYVYTA